MVRLNEEVITYRIKDAVIDYLKKGKKTQTWLAKQLGETLPSFQKKLSRDDIGIGYVTRISKILNYDFLCEASYENQILEFGFANQIKPVDGYKNRYVEVVVNLMNNQAELLAVKDKLAILQIDYDILLEQSPVRPIKPK